MFTFNPETVRILKRSALLWMLLAFTALVAAQPTLAGTKVSNQASAQYDSTSASSPTVETLVNSFCALTITPDGTVAIPGQHVNVVPGEAAIFTYWITNTGNSNHQFTLQPVVLNESTLTPESTVLYRISGTGEETALSEPLELSPGETAELRLVVRTHPERVGDVFVDFQGACLSDPAVRDEGNVSQVRVSKADFYGVSKTVTPEEGTPLHAGADVQYSISFSAGNHPLEDVVVRDPLSSYLLDVRDMTSGVITDPDTGLSAQVNMTFEADEITWRLPLVPAGMNVTLEFTATVGMVPEDAVLGNQAHLSSRAHAEDTPTNEVANPLAPAEITFQKQADAQAVSVGDTLGYTLTVSNPSITAPLLGLTLVDHLPAGVSYVSGSTPLSVGGEDHGVFEPDSTETPLRWELPAIASGSTLELRFDVVITPELLYGRALTNTAEAVGFDGESIVAQDSAVTRVDPGVFAANAVLMGRVYEDRNNNGAFDEGTDKPIAGVRLYLASGQSIISDEQGRYTFPDLAAGLEVVRVDTLTIPAGFELGAAPAEVKPGLWRLRLFPGLIEQLDVRLLALEGADRPAAELQFAVESGSPAQSETRTGVMILAPAVDAVVAVGDATNIRVDSPLGATVRLLVNDAQISEDRIGTRVLDGPAHRQTLEYVGVKLQAGPNTLRVEASDGNKLEAAERTVFLAGPPTLVSFTPLSELAADSVLPLAFSVNAVDTWGHARADGLLTVDVAGAQPATADAAPQQQGYQVRLEDGAGLLTLTPLVEAGEVTLSAVLGREIISEVFTVRSNLRPWVASGIASFGVGYTPGAPMQVTAQTTFFARGTVLGDYLLTIAAGPANARSDNPHSSFPVTGSSSSPLREAPSADGFYVRFERDLNYLLYGDFTPEFSGSLLNLSRNYTGLSGVFTPADSPITLAAYVAAPRDGLVSDVELAADGTSFYRLPHAPVTSGSLKLAVIKRDPVTDLVVEDDSDAHLGLLRVLWDYSFDERLGFIQLARPLPSRDAAGNSYALLASYRVEEDGNAPRRLQAGAEATYETDTVTAHAGAYLEQRDDTGPLLVAGVGVTYRLAGFIAEADAAYSAKADSSGATFNAKLGYETERLTSELGYGYASSGYRSSIVQKESGHHRATASVKYRLNEWVLAAAAQHTAPSGGTSKPAETTASVTADYRAQDAWLTGSGAVLGRPSALFGVEYAAGVRLLAGVAFTNIGGHEGLEFSVTHRQGLNTATRSQTDVSAGVKLLDSLNLRLIERLVWGNDSSMLIGFDTSVNHSHIHGLFCRAPACHAAMHADLGSTDVYAQYELPGGLSGEAGRILLGFDTEYPVSDTISLTGGFEQAINLSDSVSTTVLNAGVNVIEDHYGFNARYEVRFAEATKHVFNSTATFADNPGSDNPDSGSSVGGVFGTIGVQYVFDSADSADGVGFGLRLNAAGAYRGEGFDLLTRHSGEFGILAADAQAVLTGDTRLTMPVSAQWAWQAGYIYRYQDDLGFQDLLSVGISATLWQGGSLAVHGRLFHDWTRANLAPGGTLELAQQLGCGVYGVGGYNLGGGAAARGLHVDPGFYLRFDLVFDEEWRCGKGKQ